MIDLVEFATQGGPYAAALVALLAAVRAWAEATKLRESASAQTLERLRAWIQEDRAQIEKLQREQRESRARIAALESELAAAESRAEDLLLEVHRLRGELEMRDRRLAALRDEYEALRREFEASSREARPPAGPFIEVIRGGKEG